MQDHTSQDGFARENIQTWDERAEIHVRDETGFYGVERFLAGEDTMLPIESEEIGFVEGRHLLHLQCHIGLDTLCLARRGAIVTGLDFSGASITAARSLAKRARLDAHFVEANIYDATKVLEGGFDIIYVSWGSLNWLPDIWKWAGIVSELLAPGGYLYLIDQHPSVSVMAEKDGQLEVACGWRTPAEAPNVTNASTSYSGDQTPLANTRMHEWEHPLSDIVGGLLESGLRLDFLREHEELPWQRFPMMVPTEDRLFKMPPAAVAMPLGFSLKATKPGYGW
jgi:SAM-dependent methyltransferase